MSSSLFPLNGAPRSRKLFRWTLIKFVIFSKSPVSFTFSGSSSKHTIKNAIPVENPINRLKVTMILIVFYICYNNVTHAHWFVISVEFGGFTGLLCPVVLPLRF